MSVQQTIDLWGGFKHDPETCAYCKDEKLGRGLVPPVTAYECHLAAKLVELDGGSSNDKNR
jgi:hypothetical protein